MKIAYLSTFYPFRGGIAQFNALLCKALEKLGHTVKAYTFTCQYPSILFPGETQYLTEDDRKHAIPMASEAVLNTVNPLSYETTARQILKAKPDMLIMKYWMSFFAPSLAYVAHRLKKKGVKIVCVIDNAIPHEAKFFDKPLARLFFKQCDYFIVMSDIVKNDLLRLKPDAQFCQTPHPLYDHYGETIDIRQARKQLDVNGGDKTLLFFGLIRDYKGLDLLIEAMNLLDNSYQLIIAGESYGSFDKYQKQIAQSSATKRITVINRYIGDADIPVLFSAADAIVLPYKSATQSGVIPVAYHFEVPIVTTDVGGLKDAIAGAGTGIVCQPTAQSLADGIKKIYQIPHSQFIAAIQREKAALSWEKFAEKILVKPL